MLIDFLIIVAGVSGILFFAEFVIYSAAELAHYLGLSASFVALTILSIGTSVPELISLAVMEKNIGPDIF